MVPERALERRRRVNYGRGMTIYGVRQQVACYVTRAADAGADLLTFEPCDDGPSSRSGVRIPTGVMTRFEAIETAALRQVEEESGLAGLTFERQLGAVELGLHDAGGPSVTTYVHLSAPSGREQAWVHNVSGDGEDAGMTFVWRWQPLPLTVDLAPGQAAYLGQIAG